MTGAAGAGAGAVLAFYPVYVLASGSELVLRTGWLWLAIGSHRANLLRPEPTLHPRLLDRRHVFQSRDDAMGD